MVLNLDFFRRRSSPAILLILLTGIIAYANTFKVPFVLDDHLWITQNEIIKNLDNFFTNFSAYKACRSRFVGLFTLALNYHFGGLDVAGYHAVNLIFLLLTALLVYALVNLTFLTPYYQSQQATPVSTSYTPRSILQTPNRLLPLFAALLFVAHPVQTQAVTYIVQRMTSLATLFYLLSLVLYVKARLAVERPGYGIQNPKLTDQERGKNTGRVAIYSLFGGSVLAAVLAMKTKEIAFTLPFAVLLYESYFFQGAWKRRLLYLLPLLATLPIVPMSVLATARSLGQSVGQSAGGSQLSRLDYFFTQFRVIVTYLRLLVLPVGQNLDHDYPVYHTFFTPPVFLSFLLLAAIFVLAVYLFHASRKGAGPMFRLISFGILWFFLTISVESSLVPILDVIVEHRLYLPSIGAAIAFSAAFFLLSEKFFHRRAGLPILAGAMIVISLSVATYQRNNVWGSAVGLWEDVVSKSPQKPRSLNNLGRVLIDAGRPWEAIQVLRRSLALSSDFDKAYFNLGRSYLMIGQDREAIPLFRKAIEINPDFQAAYNELGAALIQEKRYGEAIALLERNLDLLGEMPEVRFNLGVAYFNSGHPAKARRELEILSRLDKGLATRLADFLH